MEIDLCSYRLVTKDRKSFYVYKLNIRFFDWQNVIEKRFSEFYELHTTMELVKMIVPDKLPKFPSKLKFKSFTGKLTEKDLNERMKNLDVYIKSLEKTKCAKHSLYFPNFCGLPIWYRNFWATRGIKL